MMSKPAVKDFITKSLKKEHVFCFALAAFFIAQGVYSALNNSVTVDEYVHLPVSISILQTRDVTIDHNGSPPLRAVLALPALLLAPVMDYGSDLWKNKEVYGFSWLFMKNNFYVYHDLFLPPRIVVLGISLLLFACLYNSVRGVFGERASVFCALLFFFNPEIIAHSSLVTVDMLVTCFFLFLFIISFAFYGSRVYAIH